MFELIKEIFIGLLTDLDNRFNHTNKAKTLTEHISCECKCRFDGRRCNSGQGEIMINVDVSVNFSEAKITSLVIFLITIALLIAVSIYYYLIKYWAKQKHLLSFRFTNNKLKI